MRRWRCRDALKQFSVLLYYRRSGYKKYRKLNFAQKVASVRTDRVLDGAVYQAFREKLCGRSPFVLSHPGRPELLRHALLRAQRRKGHFNFG